VSWARAAAETGEVRRPYVAIVCEQPQRRLEVAGRDAEPVDAHYRNVIGRRAAEALVDPEPGDLRVARVEHGEVYYR
jgi:hypothetical protein